MVEGGTLRAFSDAYVEHVREAHPDWPFPEIAIRNVAEATQRLTGSTERLDTIGAIEVHPVVDERNDRNERDDRIEDWLAFFDHDAFAGNPVDAVCYCTGPLLGDTSSRPWQVNRSCMVEMLRNGRAYGYLAYAGNRTAGWVNATMRENATIDIGCFAIAPPFRRHGVAGALLAHVLADAQTRGAKSVEARPLNQPDTSAAANYRGHLGLFLAHGFVVVERREHDSLVRRPVRP
ncbi:hypothetical protein GCM10027569_62330 [Flindersiella endophytica]